MGIFLFVAIAVTATVLIAFFANSISSQTSPTTSPAPSLTPSPTLAPTSSPTSSPTPPPIQAPDNERYLTYYSSHYVYGGNETKIFLLTSNARYGSYNQSFQTLYSGEVHEGDACIIINVTIRNDYTKEQPGPDGFPDFPEGPFPSGYFISLTAYLYNKEGQVMAEIMTPGYMYGGFIEVNLETGETATFDIYVAYDKQDVDHYELYIFNIQALPTP